MKFTVDVDCTPEEARRFIGLPDVAPLQEAMMKELQKQMMDNIKSLDAESMMKTWMNPTIQGWSEMQKIFWAQMGLTPPGADASKKQAK
ncbi:MAG TPA: hypothetical protein DEA55_06130 [Rhodospirillaceae bacterium]|nr:hypothetical protein [Rhodospirillaceae bacterium]